MTVLTPHERPLLVPPARPELVRLLLSAARRRARRLGLPSGLADGSPAWRRRHTVALATATAGLPALALLGAAAGRGLPVVVVALIGPAVLLAAAGLRALPSRVRTAAAAAGVMAACCAGVGLSPATTEAHFTFFLAAVLLGLYRDWAAYPAAVAAALLWPDLPGPAGGVVPVTALPGVGGLHAAFVVAGAAVTLVGWALADISTRGPAATASRTRSHGAL